MAETVERHAGGISVTPANLISNYFGKSQLHRAAAMLLVAPIVENRESTDRILLRSMTSRRPKEEEVNMPCSFPRRNRRWITTGTVVLGIITPPDFFVSGQPHPLPQRRGGPFWKRDPRRGNPFAVPYAMGLRPAPVAVSSSDEQNSEWNAVPRTNASTTTFYSPIGGALENNTSILQPNTNDIVTSHPDILLQHAPPAAFVTTTKPIDTSRHTLVTALIDRLKQDAARASSSFRTTTAAASPSRPGGRRVIGSVLLRAIGSAFVALFGTTTDGSQWMAFPTLYFWALVGSSVGFHLYLYFISIGHALGIFLPVLVTLMRYLQRIKALALSVSPSAVLHSVLVLLWSIRLCAFLLWREYIGWPALHAKIRRVQVDWPQKFTCWFLYSFLSVGMMTPCWWRLQFDVLQQQQQNGSRSVLGILPKTASLLGIVFQMTGLLLESVADYQKSAFKSQNSPGSWCHVGLWKYSTHPNYAGEWLFWCGTVVAVLPTLFVRHAAISTVARFLHGTFLLAAFYVLTIILHGAAQKLDQKQKIKYGSRGSDAPEFLAFTQSTGIFGPRRYHVLSWRRRYRTVSINDEDAERLPRIQMAPSTEDVLDSTLAATEEIYR